MLYRFDNLDLNFVKSDKDFTKFLNYELSIIVRTFQPQSSLLINGVLNEFLDARERLGVEDECTCQVLQPGQVNWTTILANGRALTGLDARVAWETSLQKWKWRTHSVTNTGPVAQRVVSSRRFRVTPHNLLLPGLVWTAAKMSSWIDDNILAVWLIYDEIHTQRLEVVWRCLETGDTHYGTTFSERYSVLVETKNVQHLKNMFQPKSNSAPRSYCWP